MTWAVFRDEQVQAIGEIIQSGSERVTAIVGGALLDDTLRRTLAERFRNDENWAEKLLKVNAPLGNLVPKIDVLYMLFAFEKPIRIAMYGIAEARNYFAHHLDARFDSPNKHMVAALDKMKLHEGRTHYPHHLFKRDNVEKKHRIEPVRNSKDRFIVNLQLCLIALMQDRVSHDPHSSKTRTEDEILAAVERNQRR